LAVRRIPIVAIAIASLLTAGCGGDSKPEAAEQPRLTQREFVRQGNKVCIDSDRRVYRIGSLGPNPTGWRDTSKAAKQGIRDMLALRPPRAKRKQFDAMIASARQLERSVTEVYEGLRADNPGKARAAQARAVRADSIVKRHAHGLGLTFCEQLLTNWPA
jgi:hypothetical protein